MLPSINTSHREVHTDESYGESNEQLMERIKQRDERALQELFARHRPLLRTILCRILACDADADDVVQDCMLEIWNSAAHYDSTKGQALGWIVTLVRRRGIDRARRNVCYNRAQERLRKQGEAALESTHIGADELASQGDRAIAIAQLIAHLPKVQQEALLLSFFNGLSQREIAKQTGIPLGTIKTRIELGLRKLRSAVTVFGELHEPNPHHCSGGTQIF